MMKLSIENQLCEFIDENAFDGQFKGVVPESQIIERYIEEINTCKRNPVFIKDKKEQIFFSWINQPWDSILLNQRVKRIDFILEKLQNQSSFERIFDFFQSDTDVIFYRLNAQHPLVNLTISNKKFGMCLSRKLMLKYRTTRIENKRKSNLFYLSELNTEDCRSCIKRIASNYFKENESFKDKYLGKHFSDKFYSSAIETYLERPEDLLCFIDKDTVVGFIASHKLIDIFPGQSFLFLDLLAIEPEYRNSNLENQLIQRLKADAFDEGIEHVFSNIDFEHTDNIKIFEKEAFEEFNVINEYLWKKDSW